MGMLQDKDIENESINNMQGVEQWTELIDRGGLWVLQKQPIDVLCCYVEYAVREVLKEF